MTFRPVESCWQIPLVVAGAVLCLIMGCGPKAERSTFHPDAKVRDLETGPGIDLPPPPRLSQGGDRLTVDAVWVTLPLRADLEDAWALVDPSATVGTTLDALALNGIRAGVLPAREWAAFQEALPQGVGVSVSSPRQAMLTDHPVAIWKSPPLTGTVAVLPAPTSNLPTAYHTGGRLQLLLRVTGVGGQTQLDLIPHHHVTQPLPYEVVNGRVRLRTPLERELDGTLFDPLTLRTPVPQPAFLIVGLRPVEARTLQPTLEPPADSSLDPAPGSDPLTQADAPPPPVFSETEEDPAPLLPLLGTAFFTGREGGGDVQKLLVIPLGG